MSRIGLTVTYLVTVAGLQHTNSLHFREWAQGQRCVSYILVILCSCWLADQQDARPEFCQWVQGGLTNPQCLSTLTEPSSTGRQKATTCTLLTEETRTAGWVAPDGPSKLWKLCAAFSTVQRALDCSPATTYAASLPSIDRGTLSRFCAKTCSKSPSDLNLNSTVSFANLMQSWGKDRGPLEVPGITLKLGYPNLTETRATADANAGPRQAPPSCRRCQVS
jgi:hypothetical protein